MLNIPTFIGSSPIHGIGLFAQEPVAKGTLVWEFCEGMDRYITDEEMAKQPKPVLDFIYFYYFRSKITGQYALLADNDRFTNHSYTPNVGGPETLGHAMDGGLALRDIEAGEEITNDYSMFDADFHLYSHVFPREEEKVLIRVSRKMKPRKQSSRGLPTIGQPC